MWHWPFLVASADPQTLLCCPHIYFKGPQAGSLTQQTFSPRPGGQESRDPGVRAAHLRRHQERVLLPLPAAGGPGGLGWWPHRCVSAFPTWPSPRVSVFSLSPVSLSLLRIRTPVTGFRACLNNPEYSLRHKNLNLITSAKTFFFPNKVIVTGLGISTWRMFWGPLGHSSILPPSWT